MNPEKENYCERANWDYPRYDSYRTSGTVRYLVGYTLSSLLFLSLFGTIAFVIISLG